MINKVLFTGSLFLSSLVAFGQDPSIQISTSRNADNSVDINYEKPEGGNMTVALRFKELSNTSTNGNTYTAKGYSGTLLTLKPTNKNERIGYAYSYRTIRGKLMPEFDADYTYLLPYAASTTVMARQASFIGSSYFGNKEPEDWAVFYFYTTEQQPVLAARKGLVVDVSDNNESLDSEKVSYSSKSNKVIVEHTDGTLGSYSGFDKGSIKVKVGETVIPGQELGMNMKRGEGKYSISFMVSYLKQGDLFINQNKNVSNAESYYGWINPLYLTAEGPRRLETNSVYKAHISDAVIKKELTKKELKKLDK